MFLEFVVVFSLLFFFLAHFLTIFVMKNRLFYTNIMKIWAEQISSLQ